MNDAMTLTDDEPTPPPADTVGGAGPGRQPIDDVGAYPVSYTHLRAHETDS